MSTYRENTQGCCKGVVLIVYVSGKQQELTLVGII
jgi:hypothetical protein